MHLGNGAVTPECAVLMWGAASAGLAVCARSVRRGNVTSDRLQQAAALGCLIFAAQAINVPVAPGFSGHLVGGALVAWLVGPAIGAWTMAVVLLVQAVLLGDGGLAALGANIVNMALLPAGLVALATRRVVGTAHPTAMRLSVVSGLAVVIAAVLIVGQTALFRTSGELAGWSGFAGRMIGAHLWIGLFEAAATVAVLSAVAVFNRRCAVRPVVLGVACIVLLVAAMLPISSVLPDGYEAAAEASGMSWLLR